MKELAKEMGHKACLKVTEDGKPICFKCRGVGHVARRCTLRCNEQGNGAPKSSELRDDQTVSVAIHQIVHGQNIGLGPDMSQDQLLERAVGKCLVVDI